MADQFETFEDVTEIIKEKMYGLVSNHIKNFELIYQPFYFDSIRFVMKEIIQRTDEFCLEKEKELKELLKFKLMKQYPLEDKAVVDFDYMEQYFDAVKSKNDNDIVIDNFLNQQRLLEILGNQEIKALQEAEDLQITFENTAQTHDGVYSVYLLKENQNLNVLYGFSENTIFVYDEEMNVKHEIDNDFGDVKEVDFLDDLAALGSFGGNIYLAKGEELEVYFKYNISL